MVIGKVCKYFFLNIFFLKFNKKNIDKKCNGGVRGNKVILIEVKDKYYVDRSKSGDWRLE